MTMQRVRPTGNQWAVVRQARQRAGRGAGRLDPEMNLPSVLCESDRRDGA